MPDTPPRTFMECRLKVSYTATRSNVAPSHTFWFIPSTQIGGPRPDDDTSRSVSLRSSMTGPPFLPSISSPWPAPAGGDDDSVSQNIFFIYCSTLTPHRSLSLCLRASLSACARACPRRAPMAGHGGDAETQGLLVGDRSGGAGDGAGGGGGVFRIPAAAASEEGVNAGGGAQRPGIRTMSVISSPDSTNTPPARALSAPARATLALPPMAAHGSGARDGVRWLDLSWLMLTDVVGTSVLTFAGVAAALGWVPSVLLITLACPVAIYTAMLMSRTYKMLARRGVVVGTMGTAARHTLGGAKGARVVYVAVYGFALMGQASYLLVLGKALQGVFFEQELCLPTATLLSCLAVAPLIVTVRRLVESVCLCLVNLFLILGVIGICEYQLFSVGRADDVESFAFAQNLTFMSACGALTNILYAFAGHWLYFELITVMRRPSQFPKVFLVNGPLQVSLYLLVACSGYWFQGQAAQGYFLDNLPKGELYRIASVLLFVHVVVAYLLKSVVLARFFHATVAPGRVDEASWAARVQYGGFALGQLFVGYFVANAIPFFDTLLGLIGGLLSAPISYGLPVMFYLGAVAKVRGHSRGGHRDSRRRVSALASDERMVFVGQGDGEHDDEDGDDGGMGAAGLAAGFGEEDNASWCAWLAGVARSQRAGFAAVSAQERAAFAALFMLVASAMVLGTVENVVHVVDGMSKVAAPFDCHLLNLTQPAGAGRPHQ